jgi:hypothetical protein
MRITVRREFTTLSSFGQADDPTCYVLTSGSPGVRTIATG